MKKLLPVCRKQICVCGNRWHWPSLEQGERMHCSKTILINVNTALSYIFIGFSPAHTCNNSCQSSPFSDLSDKMFLCCYFADLEFWQFIEPICRIAGNWEWNTAANEQLRMMMWNAHLGCMWAKHKNWRATRMDVRIDGINFQYLAQYFCEKWF